MFALALCAVPAWAQSPSNADLPDDAGLPSPALAPPSLVAEVVGGLWLPRLNGQSTLGGGGRVDVATNLELDDLEDVVNVELTLRKSDKWNLRLSGFDFSTEARGIFNATRTFGTVNLSPGDAFRATADMFSVALEFGWNLGRDDGQLLTGYRIPDDEDSDLRFAPMIGIRYVDFDQVVERPGVGSQRAGGEWAVITGGLGMRFSFAPEEGLILGESLHLNADASVGAAVGGDGGFVWRVNATLVLDVAPDVGVFFGYRLLELDVGNQAYDFDGGLQGIFVGGSIRF